MVDIKITNGMMIEQLASTASVSIFRVLYMISKFISIISRHAVRE